MLILTFESDCADTIISFKFCSKKEKLYKLLSDFSNIHL